MSHGPLVEGSKAFKTLNGLRNFMMHTAFLHRLHYMTECYSCQVSGMVSGLASHATRTVGWRSADSSLELSLFPTYSGSRAAIADGAAARPQGSASSVG